MAVKETLTVGLAQIAPVWLDRQQTLNKVLDFTSKAAAAGCELVIFGEALLPGYPFWIERTDGARFNSPVQKALHAHYLDQAVQIEAGHLGSLCDLARQAGVAVYLGCIERPADRGSHSIYASLVYIDMDGRIGSVHRKLRPTYEERLTWSSGDGHGLRVHPIGPFSVGGLNCWENWMPLARAALHGMGENLHIAVWPGGKHNTEHITRYMAREGRSYVVSVSGLMRRHDFPSTTPSLDLILAGADDLLADGGSCVAGPDGQWLVEPHVGQEQLIVCTLDHRLVLEERHNFDPSGHYARPDVFRLVVNRERQRSVVLKD